MYARTMRTLIVTGGTGGLGTEVVKRLARDYRCIVLYREQAGFDALLAEVPDAAGVAVDLGDERAVGEAIARAAGESGPLYGLVHMAGGFAMGRLADTTVDSWNAMLALNATSSMVVIRETLRHLEGAGRIVAISSDATIEKGKGSVAYTVSKSALNVLVEIAAKEVKGTGITVNALVPSTLDTPASRKAMPDAARVPLARVAETIAFLLSDAAGSINGALIPLQGTRT